MRGFTKLEKKLILKVSIFYLKKRGNESHSGIHIWESCSPLNRPINIFNCVLLYITWDTSLRDLCVMTLLLSATFTFFGTLNRVVYTAGFVAHCDFLQNLYHVWITQIHIHQPPIAFIFLRFRPVQEEVHCKFSLLCGLTIDYIVQNFGFFSRGTNLKI